MKTKRALSILILFYPMLIYSQTFTLLNSHYNIEYEAAYPGSYYARLNNVWKISNLQYGQDVAFVFEDWYGTGDEFTSVVYDFYNWHDWDVPYDPTPVNQIWTWEGPNNGTEYVSVDIYIDDYEDVELGLYDDVVLGITYSPTYTVYKGTVAEVTTSMSLSDPPHLDCSAPVVYPLYNFGGVAGASASWVIKQNGATKASGTGSYATTSNVSNGGVDVKFTVSFPDGLESLEFSEEYAFGIMNNTVVTGQAAVCHNSLYVYTADVPGGHGPSYSYSWTYPSGWYYYSQWTNHIQLQTPILPENMTYGSVRVSVTNACGTSSGYSGITVYPGYNCGGYYMASPNPAATHTEIDIASEDAKELETSYDSNITLTVVDKMGSPVMKVNVESLPYKLDTSKLPNGEYVVQIISQPKDQEPLIDSIKLIVSE